MKLNSSLGAPEAIGVAIVGATLGAVACGAAVSGFTAHTIIGAMIGAASPLALLRAATLARKVRMAGALRF